MNSDIVERFLIGLQNTQILKFKDFLYILYSDVFTYQHFLLRKNWKTTNLLL